MQTKYTKAIGVLIIMIVYNQTSSKTSPFKVEHSTITHRGAKRVSDWGICLQCCLFFPLKKYPKLLHWCYIFFTLKNVIKSIWMTRPFAWFMSSAKCQKYAKSIYSRPLRVDLDPQFDPFKAPVHWASYDLDSSVSTRPHDLWPT